MSEIMRVGLDLAKLLHGVDERECCWLRKTCGDPRSCVSSLSLSRAGAARRPARVPTTGPGAARARPRGPDHRSAPLVAPYRNQGRTAHGGEWAQRLRLDKRLSCCATEATFARLKELARPRRPAHDADLHTHALGQRFAGVRSPLGWTGAPIPARGLAPADRCVRQAERNAGSISRWSRRRVSLTRSRLAE